MIFKEHEYSQHVPAGDTSRRGFSVPCVKYQFTLMKGYTDAWEESNFSTEITLLVPPHTWRHPLSIMRSNTFMYGLLVSPYSTHILAGKTEELYALCRQETLLSYSVNPAGTRSTSVSTEVGFVMGRIPHFCKPPSGEILPSCVLEGRNHYGNV